MQKISYSPTNDELVQRCLEGDSSAWELLVQRYARLVHSVPARHGLSKEDVEDIAQDVFLSLARNLHQIKDVDALGKWLLVTARHRSWRVCRKRAKEQPTVEADLSDAYPAQPVAQMLKPIPGITELMELWSQRELLGYGLEQLSGRCRQLLYLLFLDPEQPSYDGICEALAMPKGSIGPTRKRCLEQLRNVLKENGDLYQS